jgi:Arc/MetJ family transcription regulator
MRSDYDFSGGRRGVAVPSPGKTRITIMLDDDVLAFFRNAAEAQGVGYQTMVNAALRHSVAAAKTKRIDDGPVTMATLRRILREELKASAAKEAA